MSEIKTLKFRSYFYWCRCCALYSLDGTHRSATHNNNNNNNEPDLELGISSNASAFGAFNPTSLTAFEPPKYEDISHPPPKYEELFVAPPPQQPPPPSLEYSFSASRPSLSHPSTLTRAASQVDDDRDVTASRGAYRLVTPEQGRGPARRDGRINVAFVGDQTEDEGANPESSQMILGGGAAAPSSYSVAWHDCGIFPYFQILLGTESSAAWCL